MYGIYFIQMYYNIFFCNYGKFIWQSIFFGREQMYLRYDSFEKMEICLTWPPLVGTYLVGNQRNWVEVIYPIAKAIQASKPKELEIEHAVILIGASITKKKGSICISWILGQKFLSSEKGETESCGLKTLLD